MTAVCPFCLSLHRSEIRVSDQCVLWFSQDEILSLSVHAMNAVYTITFFFFLKPTEPRVHDSYIY